MSELALELLPNVPQCETLRRAAPRLWARQDVVALWIGGSLAKNGGDVYSDVDLRVAVLPDALALWRDPDFHLPFSEPDIVAQQWIPFGESAFLHHLLLANGDIYDVWVQSSAAEPSPEAVLILGCRDETLSRRLLEGKSPSETEYPPADATAIRQALTHFWINSHKHRKVLYRDLPLLVLTGLQHDRALLQRLWYVLATGRDCGEPRSSTIFSLTRIARTIAMARSASALAVLGASLESAEAICRAVELLREEVSQAGQSLASQLGFTYPSELEATVRRGWQDFKGGGSLDRGVP